jgi:septal ring factor EnvC (AmiA/AmiB activator)
MTGSHRGPARIVAKEEPMTAHLKLVRRRKAKLDVKIARVKRRIRTLARQLRRQHGVLSKQLRARKKVA